MREVTDGLAGRRADAAPARRRGGRDPPVAPRTRPRPDADRRRGTGSPGPTAGGGRRPRQRLSWKAVATVVLLGVLAAAVTLVLLQSAGVISWGFLGPTA